MNFGGDVGVFLKKGKRACSLSIDEGTKEKNSLRPEKKGAPLREKIFESAKGGDSFH